MEELNVECRRFLLRRMDDINTSMFTPKEVELLVIANFLREISDTLARIDERLSGMEMNTRPGP